MIWTIRRIASGEGVASAEIPTEIHEFFLCKEFKWSIQEVRNLSPRDFKIFCTLLTMYNKTQNDLQKKAIRDSKNKQGSNRRVIR